MQDAWDERSSGSSPRGREKRARFAWRGPSLGLIPAWAGKTPTDRTRGVRTRAHPRVGGENISSLDVATRPAGSSPRGRGKPVYVWRTDLNAGLIPAWAGKTMRSHRRAGRTEAHPRVGGENWISGAQLRGSEGSSPRGRGKLHHPNQELYDARLIPAWAGKTIPYQSCLSSSSAHPRVGGENSLDMSDAQLTQGSSPRGRGKPRGVSEGGTASRLIPAWAGKTGASSMPAQVGVAHPRVGGENARSLRKSRPRAGSSPRGRGKPLGWPWGAGLVGLIPAWAGKTST